MPSRRRSVLIGDANTERFELLSRILDDDFLLEADAVENGEDLILRAKNAQWNLILVAEGLPLSGKNRESVPDRYLSILDSEVHGATLGCIVSEDKKLSLPGMTRPPVHIYVPSEHPTPKQRELIVVQLATVLDRVPPPPDLPLEKTVALRELVRSLSLTRELSDGRRQLASLIRNFQLDFDTCQIEELGQGLSGAKVFLVLTKKGDAETGYVLKVTSAEDLWKIEQEIKQHDLAKATLGVPGYRVHLAEIKLPGLPDDPSHPQLKFAVSHGAQWYAICYDFLGGGRFGKFMDLETALLASAQGLQEKIQGTRLAAEVSGTAPVESVRSLVLKKMLHWLCQNWYMKPGPVPRQERCLWQTEGLPENAFAELPPYRLPTRRKGYILGFLESKPARMGARFFERWEDHRKSVEDLVEKREGGTGINALDKKVSVVLSPAHGDLNGNNILLWLDNQDQPFLIDLPFYQESGHALQDLARLEVEIKFAHMDRQEDTPQEELPGLDLTPSQVPLWQEMEEYLLSGNWKEPKPPWSKKGYAKNVERCLEWVRMVRSKASEVQRQGLPPNGPPQFLEEYLPALLFHTLQAIGWPSLSIFKRLLAVYSAASILERLNQLG